MLEEASTDDNGKKLADLGIEMEVCFAADLVEKVLRLYLVEEIVARNVSLAEEYGGFKDVDNWELVVMREPDLEPESVFVEEALGNALKIERIDLAKVDGVLDADGNAPESEKLLELDPNI